MRRSSASPFSHFDQTYARGGANSNRLFDEFFLFRLLLFESRIIFEHKDRFPGAILGAKLAADAHVLVDDHEFGERAMLGARQDVDTIHGAEINANLASRATVRLDHGDGLGFLFARVGFFSEHCRLVSSWVEMRMGVMAAATLGVPV